MSEEYVSHTVVLLWNIQCLTKASFDRSSFITSTLMHAALNKLYAIRDATMTTILSSTLISLSRIVDNFTL